MHTLRRHRRTFASLAASLFLVVWGAMAVAPCLMALTAASAEAAESCGHCPESPPCHEDGGAPCTYIDGYDYDGREPAGGTADLRMDLMATADGALVVHPSSPDRNSAPVDPQPPVPGGPRLHLRNCVLLD